jgi:hypothetical protein
MNGATRAGNSLKHIESPKTIELATAKNLLFRCLEMISRKIDRIHSMPPLSSLTPAPVVVIFTPQLE